MPSTSAPIPSLWRNPPAFMWRALKEFRAQQGLLLAGAVAYHALLSIVPLLILSVIVLFLTINVVVIDLKKVG